MLCIERDIKLCSFISHSGAFYTVVIREHVYWRTIRSVSFLLRCERSTSFSLVQKKLAKTFRNQWPH